MDREMSEHILNTLSSGYNSIQYLESCLQSGELHLSAFSIFDQIGMLVSAVEESVSILNAPQRVKEINANIHYYIDLLKSNLVEEQLDSFVYHFRYHFVSLFRILEFEVAYIVETFIDKSDYPKFYPETVPVNHAEVAAAGASARCKVSVVLLAYNHLEYTKDCVESILSYTDDVEYELILVNNGSTDGTKAYFDSIPGAKVIHLEHNIHLVKGFNIGLMAAEGKYCAAVCNDFIFTPRWLSNLMLCIESDPQIGFVSPGATSISNLQEINIPFDSKEDFIKRAEAYNKSDSSKWEERVVLLPNVLCCPTALLDKIGYYDTRYYRGEFLDDDISFRIRRAGYKLIYCGDTVTHHYGSVTTATDHQMNSMAEGRRTFFSKYGFDAWDDARTLQIVLGIDYAQMKDVKTILGIEVKCGASLLHIKNNIWSNYGVRPQLTTAMMDKKYESDQKTISTNNVHIKNITDVSNKITEKMDFIYIEEPLDTVRDELDDIFACLAGAMHDNGHLLFTMNNNLFIGVWSDLLHGTSSIHNRKIYFLNDVCDRAKKYGFVVTKAYQLVNPELSKHSQTINDISGLLSEVVGLTDEYIRKMLSTKQICIQCSYQSGSQQRH